MTAGLKWSDSGTNGTGGTYMTQAIVESSSGAAFATVTSPRTTSALRGRIRAPDNVIPTGTSRYWNLVTTPKFPPPPRIAQNRSGFTSSLAVTVRPSAVTSSTDTRL